MLANGDQKTHFGPHGDQRGSSGWAPPLWKMSIALRFFSRCTPLWPQQPFFGQNISLKNKGHQVIWSTYRLVLVGLNWSRSRGLFTQNGSDSLNCIAAQHCLSNWRRFFILFPENKTFFQIKLFCTFMVWRDIFWISLLSSVFLVQLSNVSPQPAFCPNYDCSDWKIIELFLASL